MALLVRSDGCTITNNTIANNSYTGLYALNCRDTKITGNKITGSGYYGIYLNGAANVLLDGNLINMSGQYDIYMSSSAVTLSGNNYTSLIRRWRLNARILTMQTSRFQARA